MLADLCPACLKLRLYRGNDFHIGKLLCQHRKNLPYGDKGYIHAQANPDADQTPSPLR